MTIVDKRVESIIQAVRHYHAIWNDPEFQDDMRKALYKALRRGKQDPPPNSAVVSFGPGSSITITVTVENVQGRTGYAVVASQPGNQEQTIATAPGPAPPASNTLSGAYNMYDSSKTLVVKLKYRDPNIGDKTLQVTFPIATADGSQLMLN